MLKSIMDVPIPPDLCSLLGGVIVTGSVKKIQDLKVSEEVYWHLVHLKIEGKFRSIDEVLRKNFDLTPGDHPYLKCKEDDPDENIRPE